MPDHPSSPIYQSRQRGDVDIPRSIINKAWNPKYVRLEESVRERGRGEKSPSSLSVLWSACASGLSMVARFLQTQHRTRKMYPWAMPLFRARRELMEFYIFPGVISYPRFHGPSRFRFCSGIGHLLYQGRGDRDRERERERECVWATFWPARFMAARASRHDFQLIVEQRYSPKIRLSYKNKSIALLYRVPGVVTVHPEIHDPFKTNFSCWLFSLLFGVFWNTIVRKFAIFVRDGRCMDMYAPVCLIRTI